MDAAASPLPREETTPPVTKMYLVACPSGLLIRFRSQREKGPHPFSQVRISKRRTAPLSHLSHHVAGAAINRRSCSRTSGVPPPTESYFVSTALMQIRSSSAPISPG